MTKRWALMGALLLCARGLFAGDVANFINLGFSPDSKYFFFGEYGVNDHSNPYAALFGVDVPTNTFVSNGVHRKTFDTSATVGQDGLGAFLTLFGDSLPLSRRYHINNVLVGRELYLYVDGTESRAHIEFRDFRKNNRYDITLRQTKYGSGATVSSSFYINLTIHDSQGNVLQYTVGLPNYRRQGVESYRITKVILGPDNRSLVFVVQKRERDQDGVDIRYMVETVKTGL